MQVSGHGGVGGRDARVWRQRERERDGSAAGSHVNFLRLPFSVSEARGTRPPHHPMRDLVKRPLPGCRGKRAAAGRGSAAPRDGPPARVSRFLGRAPGFSQGRLRAALLRMDRPGWSAEPGGFRPASRRVEPSAAHHPRRHWTAERDEVGARRFPEFGAGAPLRHECVPPGPADLSRTWGGALGLRALPRPHRRARTLAWSTR
jgi:hypothetical protein